MKRKILAISIFLLALSSCGKNEDSTYQVNKDDSQTVREFEEGLVEASNTGLKIFDNVISDLNREAIENGEKIKEERYSALGDTTGFGPMPHDEFMLYYEMISYYYDELEKARAKNPNVEDEEVLNKVSNDLADELGVTYKDVANFLYYNSDRFNAQADRMIEEHNNR